MKKQLTTLLMLFSLFLVSCQEDDFDAALAPIVTVDDVKTVYRTVAELSASVSRSEGRSITESGFILSTYNDFTALTLDEIRASSACKVVTTDRPVTAGQMSLQATGLTANTHYYYCAFVSSGYSVARSEVKEFTTPQNSIPVFDDIAVSDITINSSHVSSRILDIGGDVAVNTFEFWYKEVGASETPTTLNRGDCIIVDAPGYSATLNGLKKNSRYAVCAVVTTTGSTERNAAQSKVVCFTTSNINVNVTFAQPSLNIGQNNIDISQAFSTNEMVVNEGVFYSSEVEQPNENNKYVFDKDIDKRINVSITDLPVDDYYVRPFVQVRKDDELFYVYGDVVKVSIKGPVPVLSDCEVLGVTYTAIAVSANVGNLAPDAKCGFCYEGPDNNRIYVPAAPDSEGVIKAELTPLNPNTEYIIRAYAINNPGEVYYSNPITVDTPKRSPSSDDNVFPGI